MVEAGIRKLEEGFQSPARSDKALEQFIEAKVGVFMDKQKDLYAATIRPVILTEIERRFENLIDEYIQERYPALVRRRDEELDE
jgi:hypothetical protein